MPLKWNSWEWSLVKEKWRWMERNWKPFKTGNHPLWWRPCNSSPDLQTFTGSLSQTSPTSLPLWIFWHERTNLGVGLLSNKECLIDSKVSFPPSQSSRSLTSYTPFPSWLMLPYSLWEQSSYKLTPTRTSTHAPISLALSQSLSKTTTSMTGSS